MMCGDAAPAVRRAVRSCAAWRILKSFFPIRKSRIFDIDASTHVAARDARRVKERFMLRGQRVGQARSASQSHDHDCDLFLRTSRCNFIAGVHVL
jgi:hypothetical protein